MSALPQSRENHLWLGAVALSVALAGCGATPDPDPTTNTNAITTSEELSARDLGRLEPFFVPPARARVVAQGIPGAGAITQVGTFHRGGPFREYLGVLQAGIIER